MFLYLNRWAVFSVKMIQGNSVLIQAQLGILTVLCRSLANSRADLDHNAKFWAAQTRNVAGPDLGPVCALSIPRWCRLSWAVTGRWALAGFVSSRSSGFILVLSRRCECWCEVTGHLNLKTNSKWEQGSLGSGMSFSKKAKWGVTFLPPTKVCFQACTGCKSKHIHVQQHMHGAYSLSIQNSFCRSWANSQHGKTTRK